MVAENGCLETTRNSCDETCPESRILEDLLADFEPYQNDIGLA